MIEILIFLVVIGLIGNLLGKLFNWLKEQAAAIAGIIILAVIAGAVIAAGSFLLPIVIEYFPFVLIGSLILIVTYSAVTKKQRRTFIAWAERFGFGKQDDAPGSKRIWKWASKKGYTEDSDSGYVWSVRFYQNVLNSFYERQAVTAAEFQNFCIQTTSMFNPANTLAFLDCLRLRKILQPLVEAGRDTLYLSSQVIADCELLFEAEGGATEKEFSQICENEMSAVPVDSPTLAKFILENMVSHGAASKVELTECSDGDVLYVSKRNIDNSKMKRVEISLDD